MGFKKILGSLLGGGSQKSSPPPPKPDAPDYGTLWNQYTGWTADINSRYDASQASTRARMAAAGNDPDTIGRVLGGIGAERDAELKTIADGQTFKLLTEGFDVARGAKANPYATGPKAAGAGASDLMQYYSESYGPGSGATPKAAEELAKARAKAASDSSNIKMQGVRGDASGAGGGGGGVGPGTTIGPSSLATASPWSPESKEQNPWV